ncbi:hypothetical protein A3E39_00565 [Candidatus Uhrbacteria bacterium RIFCSPHIGHO2_12_FULL_60_25]|uniref:DUF916 domain-containing protein n=1 Tax=Candidatus Uhrbacteria bacterium RIFCSPHIGHO2_12_FULL_60_25 TaxID=1802399 RepID=A0A1F7UJQ6_9BACT|nr:MAG: hypothetical protein A3E39_00565 [Candidatus Uhrbacteria bacterium RIFCSPHIGHO2_12_FULL_60_25]
MIESHTTSMKRYVLALPLLVSSLFLPIHAAMAITVSPVVMDLEIAKGSSKQDKITVRNDSDRVQTYALTVQNFVAEGEEGAQTYVEEEQPFGLAAWVIVDKPAVTLQPGESADFPFAINIPSDAEPGGHYAAIFFSSSPGGTERTGVGVAAKTGVLLLVNVPGDIREDARVETFRMSGGGWISRLPANFELRLRNLGNTHFRPRGTLVVRNLLGSVVARVPANPKNSAVLPNSVRKIYAVWANTMDIPSGGFWTEVTNEWRNFAFGRYTASVDMTYGSQNKSLEVQSVAFWVFPWRLAILASVGVVLIFALLRLYNAMIVRAALKRSGKT